MIFAARCRLQNRWLIVEISSIGATRHLSAVYSGPEENVKVTIFLLRLRSLLTYNQIKMLLSIRVYLFNIIFLRPYILIVTICT